MGNPPGHEVHVFLQAAFDPGSDLRPGIGLHKEDMLEFMQQGSVLSYGMDQLFGETNLIVTVKG